jgi:hypothetical protein
MIITRWSVSVGRNKEVIFVLRGVRMAWGKRWGSSWERWGRGTCHTVEGSGNRVL